MSFLKKGQLPIFIANCIALLYFSYDFLNKGNSEFIYYIAVIVGFFALIVATNKKVNYPNYILWGLTCWSLLHMAGGNVRTAEGVLYSKILIPISSQYEIFKYDQFVHIVGFGVATLLMYEFLKPLIKRPIKHPYLFGIIVVAAGLGVGALNEIIEFLAVVIFESTGVGGYINTALDLVADLIGGLIALVIILVKEKKESKEK